MKAWIDHHLPPWLLPLAFPVVFVGVLWLIGTVIGRLWPKKAAAAAGPPRQTAAAWVVAFGAVFTLAGLAALCAVTVYPTYRSMRAGHWPTTPGRVISSRLAETSGNDSSTTYRIDIHFSYSVAGRAYEGTHYDSSVGSSGFREAKTAVVRANPPRRGVVVHYNPDDPADAMLSTALPPGTFALLWIPPVFIGVGVTVMVFGLRSGRRAGFWNMLPGAVPVAARAIPVAPAAANARSFRRKQFIGITAFALFWNGVTVPMFLATRSWCMAPLLLGGAFFVLMAGAAAVKMFNPVVSVVFARMPLRPGGRTEVTYAIGGNSLAVRQLTFSLEGRESVTYTQGTDTRSETHVAWRLPLFETVRPVDMERGQFDINLPADVMPTFIAVHNRLTWHLCCRGEIPHRPDIKDDFDVTVSADEGTG